MNWFREWLARRAWNRASLQGRLIVASVWKVTP